MAPARSGNFPNPTGGDLVMKGVLGREDRARRRREPFSPPRFRGRKGFLLYSPRSLQGFTLVEILVVMAITVILMGLLLGPVVTTFNLVHRGEQTSQAQETARRVLEEISREVSDALYVWLTPGDEVPIPYVDEQGRRYRVVMRNPLAVYNDRGQKLFVDQAWIDLMPPDDTLGLHGGGLQQPLTYQLDGISHPADADNNTPGHYHPVIVRYFVGLQKPYLPGQNVPRWINVNERPLTLSDQDNTYVLFRVEFDPYDPKFSNWAVPDPQNPRSGIYVLNENFFYDRALAPNGKPFWQNWRESAVAVVPMEDIDLIRFDANGQNPVSSVLFQPSAIPNDLAQPTDASRGTPTAYVTDHGNWSGLQNDGTKDFLQLANRSFSPRIIVYDQQPLPNGQTRLVAVYDTGALPSQAFHPRFRRRVVSWDSRTGVVLFAHPAPSYEILVTETLNGWRFRPTDSLGAPLNTLARIVPGSETVQVEEEDPVTREKRFVVFRRAQLAEMMDTPEPPEDWDEGTKGPWPPQLPPPGTYVLTDKGDLLIGYPWPGPENPLQPVPVPEGHRVRVTYEYQTNDPDDVVRVDYDTRSLINIILGIRIYDRATGKPLVSQLMNKVQLRNLGR